VQRGLRDGMFILAVLTEHQTVTDGHSAIAYTAPRASIASLGKNFTIILSLQYVMGISHIRVEVHSTTDINNNTNYKTQQLAHNTT